MKHQGEEKGGSGRRLISKDGNVGNPSFRVYYGTAHGAVPFKWESKPGKPKDGSSSGRDDDVIIIPPLTPPPSYYAAAGGFKSKPANTASKRFYALLPWLFSTKERGVEPPTPSSSLSSASSVSSPSSVFSHAGFSSTSRHRRTRPTTRRTFSSPTRSSFSSVDEESDEEEPPASSTMCFGLGHASTGGRFSALLSIAGLHGSSQEVGRSQRQ